MCKMNALYVTVSIPLLLVLAGFNHAHGLTTFGKTQGTQNTPQQTHVQGKACITQANCTLIKGTTCLKGYCLCGDNTHPINGGCKAQSKGPRHICTSDSECVEGADCLAPKEKNRTTNSNIPNNLVPVDKICTCQEGYFELAGMCGGGSTFSVLPALIFFIVILSRQMN